VRAHIEDRVRVNHQRLADLESMTAQLERKLAETRRSLRDELSRAPRPSPTRSHPNDQTGWFGHGQRRRSARDRAWNDAPGPAMELDLGGTDPADDDDLPDERTEVLLSHGRRTAPARRVPRSLKLAAGAAAAAGIAAILTAIVSGGGASWPASVATVQREAAVACRNPNTQSEPGQVNFACAKGTRQILWVFALMTSDDNPHFASARTGRLGLEPIRPAQGGEIAWSLNLHHPYNPADPVDSLEVAARAINNIIGGATLTGAHGKPVVQPGLEGNPQNCLRYTGSAALRSRHDFPPLCARPLTSLAGQGALVADVYQKWVVGAGPVAAQDAAVLFENVGDPGNPRVQAILRQLRSAKDGA
jgi:hypothetical protein